MGFCRAFFGVFAFGAGKVSELGQSFSGLGLRGFRAQLRGLALTIYSTQLPKTPKKKRRPSPKPKNAQASAHRHHKAQQHNQQSPIPSGGAGGPADLSARIPIAPCTPEKTLRL